MKGCIVYNDSLKSESYIENISLFSKQMDLPTMSNAELCSMKKIKLDYCVFLDKDITLARFLEKNNIKVFNSSSAIETCDNKAHTYISLYNKVNMPETKFSPLSYFESAVIEPLSYPFVVKECYGSWGKQVYLVHNFEEYQKVVYSFNTRPYIIQEYIEANGTDYRLYTVGGKVVACMQRKNARDFRANCELGGIASPFIPSNEMIVVAEKAASALQLDFGGIDLMVDNTGKVFFIEANSSAQISNLQKATNVNIPAILFEYIKKQLDF